MTLDPPVVPRIASRAWTDPRAEDARLRGRTYAISFDRVWTAAMELAGGGLSRWKVLESDDEEGVIRAEARTLLLGRVQDVRVDVGLDENGQTRVDLMSASRGGRRDLGANPRRIHRFLRALDAALQATPGQILDGAHPPQFTA